MRISALRSAAACAIMTACLTVSAYAADIIVIPEKIAFGPDVMVRDNVRDECRLEEKIAEFIQSYGKKKKGYTLVTEAPAEGEYHVLTAEIISAQGAGGGAWSGPKSIKVKGELTDAAGEVVGSFTAGRYSGGGVFGGYKGTCSILGRCTKALGKDIAAWLDNPRMNSMLGDH
ncbi:MAG: hypothetical protein AAFN78_02355 [Pseudomonadota bacterium]